MIAADQNAVRFDLRSQMPVADLPGQCKQVASVISPHLKQFLRRGDDLDDPAVIQRQPVAVAQQPRMGQVEQKFETIISLELHAAAMTRCLIQRDGIGGG